MRALRQQGRHRRGDDGAELIELAIVLPIFLLIIMGIVDFGFLFQRYEVVTNAAREGARLGATNSAAATNPNVQTRVQQYLTNAGLLDPATILASDTTQTVSGLVVNTKTVTVVYPTTLIFLPVTVNLQSVSTMRKEGGS